MKISGRDLIGLTDSELLNEMFNDTCPCDLIKRLDYKDCKTYARDESDCLDCWATNLNKEYEVEREE